MLLETLDIKKNDIIIYSQNIFNIEKNFKIIFKDDPDKLSRKINYGDVCRFVNEYTPKNLIVYRLLTNINDFRIDLSKYGFFLNINNETELIYFDPVFAVKELEEYSKVVSLNNLRFRIQQVGLTTLNRKRNLPNFAEIYAVDLEAMEAKFQNDKVFADAIFAFSFSTKGIAKRTNKLVAKKEPVKEKDSPEKKSFAQKIIKPAGKPNTEQIENIKMIKHEISEDKDFDISQIMRMNFRGKTGVDEPVEAGQSVKAEGDKKEGTQETLFAEFVKKKLENENQKPEGTTADKIDFVDIFKSGTPLKEYISQKENKKIVLKLKKK